MNYHTEVTKFQRGLYKFGFDNKGIFNRLNLHPSLYKDLDGNKILTGNIHVCTFSGVDTIAGNLGCVTFALAVKIKYKGSKITHDGMELNKSAESKYKTADEALEAFDVWHDTLQRTLRSYKKLM